jgi:hypothetical protein
LAFLQAAPVALAVIVGDLPFLNKAVGPVPLRNHVVVARGLTVLDFLALLSALSLSKKIPTKSTCSNCRDHRPFTANGLHKIPALSRRDDGAHPHIC